MLGRVSLTAPAEHRDAEFATALSRPNNTDPPAASKFALTALRAVQSGTQRRFTSSVGCPSLRHCEKPPEMCDTAVRPMSCAVLVAKADLQALAQ